MIPFAAGYRVCTDNQLASRPGNRSGYEAPRLSVRKLADTAVACAVSIRLSSSRHLNTLGIKLADVSSRRAFFVSITFNCRPFAIASPSRNTEKLALHTFLQMPRIATGSAIALLFQRFRRSREPFNVRLAGRAARPARRWIPVNAAPPHGQKTTRSSSKASSPRRLAEPIHRRWPTATAPNDYYLRPARSRSPDRSL